jgi:glutamate/tyrosine decarboxylase-like PLP-dependent enzyme
MNILGVRARDVAGAVDAFQDLGWNVSTTRIPSLRFVVMPHVKRRHVEELLEDAARIVKKGLI